MTRFLAVMLASSCFLAPNETMVGALNSDAGAGGGAAGGMAGVGGGSAGGAAGGVAGGGTAGGGSAGGTPASCAEIEVDPLTLDFGRLPYFASAPVPLSVTRKLKLRNTGCALENLRLGTPAFEIVPVTADSTLSALCVGGFDAATQTCTNALPPSYDPVVGLRAVAGQNELELAVRITPPAPDLTLEWDVRIFSNDSDEPVTTVRVRAQTVTLPPCNYSLTPPAVSFGLLPETGSRDLAFTFKNLGTNAGEDCLISALDLAPGSASIFSLPSGPLSNLLVGPGQSLLVPVRATTPSSAPQTWAGSIDLVASSPTAPQRSIPLTAMTGAGCLYLSPGAFDFGDVTQACATDMKRISIFNRCTAPVTVMFGEIFPWSPEIGLNTSPGNVPALGSTFALVFYRPQDLGFDASPFVLHAVENGVPIDYVVPLTGKGVSTTQLTDTFIQESKPKADVLVVVSNAPSMADDQAAVAGLANNFASFIAYAQRENVDYNIGVLVPDLAAPDAGRIIGGRLTPATPSVETQFRQRILNIGTNGGASPAIAETVVRALTPPLSTTVNAGFLRPDATLSVVALTDARDFSPMPAAYYEARLRDLKPFGRVISYNVIGPEWPASGMCPVDDAWPTPSVLRGLTLAFSGAHDSICAASSPTTLYESVGKRAFGFRTTFPLRRVADVSAGNTVLVRIDHGDGMGPQPIDPVDPRGAQVWTYDSAVHSVEFQPLFVPAPGDTMTVTYTPVCH